MVRELPQALQLGKDLPQVLQLGKDQFPDLVKYKQGRRQLHHLEFGRDYLHRAPSSQRVWITSKRWTRAVFFLEDPASSFNSPSSPRLAPNLASSAVPRFQPLQAVATCSPHLVRSSAPPLVQDQRAALLCNWQCYEVLVNVVTKSLVSPQRFLATMPTTKCLFFPIALSRQPRYQQWLAPQCLIVPASFFNNLEGCPAMLTMVMPTIVFNTTRLWRFLTGESPLASWFVLLLAARTLKQVKMGHLICPEIPEAPKSGALPSTDLANLLVLAP